MDQTTSTNAPHSSAESQPLQPGQTPPSAERAAGEIPASSTISISIRSSDPMPAANMDQIPTPSAPASAAGNQTQQPSQPPLPTEPAPAYTPPSTPLPTATASGSRSRSGNRNRANPFIPHPHTSTISLSALNYATATTEPLPKYSRQDPNSEHPLPPYTVAPQPQTPPATHQSPSAISIFESPDEPWPAGTLWRPRGIGLLNEPNARVMAGRSPLRAVRNANTNANANTRDSFARAPDLEAGRRPRSAEERRSRQIAQDVDVIVRAGRAAKRRRQPRNRRGLCYSGEWFGYFLILLAIGLAGFIAYEVVEAVW